MRRFIFVFVVVLLLAFGAFRIGQMLVRPSRSSNVEPTPKPTVFTPADGPKIEAGDVPKLTAIDEEYTHLVEKVIPAVVSITTQRVTQAQAARANPFDLLFGAKRDRAKPQVETSLGSGVIVSREGHVLTNNHVIEDMTEIEVQLADERAFPARLLGTDPSVDIAVLKIDAPNLDPLPIGNSDGVKVGQLVFAIGNPFGLSETVTAGIISAKSRRAMRDSTVEYLQTDAAVNQGNSGGPLINLRGEVIGINTAIFAREEDSGWLGISFAVPSNVARRALESVIKRGRITRSYLGVTMANLTPDVASKLRAGSMEGALVTDVVPGSPAERAGLKPGDIIRNFNGRPLKDIAGLRSRLNEVDAGERIELILLRNGTEMKAAAELGEAPAEATPRR